MARTDPEVVLRPGTEDDLPAVAEVFLRSRAAAVPAMPALVNSPDEVRAFVFSWNLDERELWVAEDDSGAVLGFAELKDDWLDDLYVDPAAQGQGIGSALFELMTALRPEGFSLWVFESNTPGRSFYARHGCRERERTDGSGNQERAPDIRVEWSPNGRSALSESAHGVT